MVFLISWFLTFDFSAHADELKQRLEKRLRGSDIAAAHVGLAVYDLNHGAENLVFATNEDKDLIPASVTKIATAAAALSRLGPSFKFQTGLWTAAPIKNSVLAGDLVLKGGGDPGFVSESMWFLVNELVRTGVQKIEGDVLVDDTDFDAVRADASRDPERVDRAYDAPIGAMSFNWNSINIYIRPTKVGEAPQVYLDPITNGFKIHNKAKTVASGGSQLEVTRNGNTVFVSGKIGLGVQETVVYKNIDDPIEWCGQSLRFFLKQRGIEVTGKVRSGKKPENARLLAKSDSRPLSQHVADMMKFSNNYVAEMLTKNLAAQNGQHPASLDDGMKLIRDHLNQLGLDSKRFSLINPSGLSRRNRIKSVDLARILVAAQKNFPWFAEFLSSMPLAGLDGTLKKRMKDGPAEGWIRAKTGNLSGVVALAGYAGRKDGSVRAFSFIYNGKPEKSESARHLFDGLATDLVQ